MSNCGGAAPQRGAGVGREGRAGVHHRGAGNACQDAGKRRREIQEL